MTLNWSEFHDILIVRTFFKLFTATNITAISVTRLVLKLLV